MVNMLASEARAVEAVENPRAVLGGNKPPPIHELFTRELTETYALELAKIDDLARRANEAPEKIASDDDLKLATQIYLDTAAWHKAMDTSRLNEKRPMTKAVDDVFGTPLERGERIMTAFRKRADDYNRDKLKREREQREAEEKAARQAAEKARQDAEIAAEFGDTRGVIEHAQAAASNEAEAARVMAEAPKVADVARVRADDGAGLATAKTEWKFEIDFTTVDLNALRQLIDQKAVTTAVGKIVKVQKGATKIAGVRVFEDVATQFRR